MEEYLQIQQEGGGGAWYQKHFENKLESIVQVVVVS
jgi:hypothetical protein